MLKLGVGRKISFVPGIGINVMVPMAPMSAAASWWLSGGISAANCIAAYAAKGAASYAESKINLANPGTYNLTDGVAYPTWDAVNGWNFTSVTTRILNSTIPFADGWSIIVRGHAVGSGGGSYGRFCSNEPAAACMLIIPWDGVAGLNVKYNSTVLTANELNSDGTIGITKGAVYRNGLLEGNPTGAINTSSLVFGNLPTLTRQLNGYIKGAAVYNITLDATQFLTLHTAMMAL